MKPFNTVIFLAVFLPGISRAQVFIHGRVIDATSNEAVAYANLSVTNSVIGSASDANGRFFLRVEEGARGGQIRISSVGYISRSVSVDSLAGLSDPDVVIQLTPHIQFLDEILVQERTMKPDDIVTDAIKAIPVNYLQVPFNMEFYTRTMVSDSSKNYFILETVMEAYRNGYKTGSMTQTRIKQKRTTGQSPLPSFDYDKKHRNCFPYAPNFDIRNDVIGNSKAPWSVFHPATFKKLHFSFHGLTVFDRDTVYTIKYSTKKGDPGKSLEEQEGSFSGVLFINTGDLAIVRHKQDVGRNTREIIYKKIGQHYFPYAIIARYPAISDPSMHVTVEAFLTAERSENTSEIVETIDNWITEWVPYDEKFWKAYYPSEKKQVP